MKKIPVIMLVLISLFSSVASTSAEGFLPSVSYESVPEIVVIEDDNGEAVIGYVENADGENLNTEYHGCILITPVMDAKENVSDLPDEAEQLLVETYEVLAAEDAKLSVLIPELNNVAKEALGDNATADDLVILELIDITATCEELIKDLSDASNTITLTFQLNVPKEAFVTVMTFNDGEWHFVEDVHNNGDGTVSVKFNHFCPVLFLAGLPTDDISVPHNSAVWVAALCAFILIVTVIVLFMLRRKKK